MSSIKHYVANSTGELNNLTELINKSLGIVLPIVEKELRADKIDIIFVSAASLAIPEYGIGGNSPGSNHVYVSFDPNSEKISLDGLNETLFHEIHHCIRWRDPGYGETLGETMVSEGLACLYEEQNSGKPPLYATVKLNKDQITKANKLLYSKNYNHSNWFFGGDGIDRWFGYSYGYQICKDYLVKKNKSASDLVHTKAELILEGVTSANNYES